MKFRFTLILGLIVSAVFGQSNNIRNQETKIKNSTGVQKMYDLIDLSGMYFEESFYKKAVSSAEKAKKLAKSQKREGIQALAMNKEAKALYELGRSGRKKANKILIESLEVLPQAANLPLRIENLSLLEKYALARGDEKDAYKYALQSSKLTGKKAPTPPESDGKIGGLFGKRKRKIAAIQERQEALSDSLQSLAAESQKIQSQSNRWKSRTADLDRALASERQRVQEMTEEQMISELQMAKQRQVLDSLDFAITIDSYKIARQTSLLKEKENVIRETKMKEALLQSQLYFWGAIAGIAILIGFGLWSRYYNIKKYSTELEEKNQIIEAEKARSNDLLLNILPVSIAEELKKSGFAKARKFSSVTVMFTDFKDFSKKAADMPPEDLVAELDLYFRKFDETITHFGLEKIKTIGDSYMCVGGLPIQNSTHPLDVVQAAGEFQNFVSKRMSERAKSNLPYFEMRIGIHTGPVVAGVVGEKKYAYDIWGDTVNIASRLERNCEPGSVNISKTTFEKIKQQFSFEPRGKVSAKNIGEIEMFYVKYS